MEVIEVNKASLQLRSSEELRAEVSRLLGVTAENLLRLAAVVAELERRGEDLSGLRLSLLPHLRRIAAGITLPELVVKYAGQPMLLNKLSELPVTKQKELIENPTIKLVTVSDDGFTEETVPLHMLNAKQIRQVFVLDTIREPAQQRTYLRSSITDKSKPEKPAAEVRTYRPRPDQERGGIWVGKMFVPREEIISALSSLSGKLSLPTMDTADTATVRVTAEEKAKLRAAEKKRGLPEWHIIREALQSVGII